MDHVTSIYRSVAGQRRVHNWCTDQLDRWPVAHRRFSIPTRGGQTHVVAAGERPPSVVVLAGTNFNAATGLPLIRALARRWNVWALDIPGQPGLSAAERPRRAGLSWYGRWLGEVLQTAAPAPVVIVGHSLGGGIALACDSPQVAGRVLIAPAGLARLRITAEVLAASLPWLTRPTEARSARVLRLMHAPTYPPAPVATQWMTLVSRECRSSLAPSPLSAAILRNSLGPPTVVATGEHDVFFPPRRLQRPVSQSLGIELTVIPGGGHLADQEQPDRVASLVDQVAERTRHTPNTG